MSPAYKQLNLKNPLIQKTEDKNKNSLIFLTRYNNQPINISYIISLHLREIVF